MSNWKKYGYWLLVLIILLALVIGFHSSVTAYIIEPIAVLLWVGWRTILTVDQSIYWFILIAICSVFILRLFPTWKRKARPAYSYNYASRNRVEYWQALLGDSMLGGDKPLLLRENLERLIHSVLNLSQESNSADMKQMMADGRISVPPAVQHFLFPPQEERKLFVNFQQLYSRFLSPNWLHKRMRSDTPDTTSISEILVWMENDLEIKHES